MFLRKNIPDTLLPPYDIQVRTPDYLNWDKYKNAGYLNIYSYIADAIMRAKSANPLSTNSIEVAYMPMKTPEYESIPPIATDQLSQ